MIRGMPTEAHVRSRILDAFPDASVVEVTDYTGGGDHFSVVVESATFAGRSRVDQHRLVYDAVKDEIADGSIHAFQLTTRVPQEH
jgi:stress-induced morphogen